MSLKDSFKGDSGKDFLNRLKLTTARNAKNTADKFKTLISDLKDQTPDMKNRISGIRTRIPDLKTKFTDFRIEKLSRLSRNAWIGIGAGVLGAAVICSAAFLNVGTGHVYKLTIAGQNAGYVSNEEMVTQAVDEVKADLAKKAEGLKFTVDEKLVACEPADPKTGKVKTLTENQLKKLLLAADLCKAEAWAVNINGNNVVAAATEADADSILEGVKSHYLTKGSEVTGASFKENVTVTKAAVNVADIMKPADAVSLILTGTKEPKVYTVQGGDTIWDIAIANGMTPAELAAANPGFDPDKLQIGQTLNLFQIKPYVTVRTKEIVATTEEIDFKTVYENSNTLYKGETKVKTPGVCGTKQIRSEISKENGIVVASNQVGSVITAQPQDQVTLRGTKSIATFAGTGSLASPVARIEISSPFGSRGGERHTGVDLRNPKGTPILAADDGVVIQVSNSGTPGKMVKLSHGNGLETWYEHCDTILVSVGQVVKKGQQIATVGATGNATGYHLHFEVRKNGVPQNPMNYL